MARWKLTSHAKCNLHSPHPSMKPTHGVTAVYENAAIKVDHAKCIGCNMCVKACEYGVYEKAPQPRFPPTVHDFVQNCVQCGQCSVVCPVKAITLQDETHGMKAAAEQGKQIIALVAPATRFGIGDAFGVPAGTDCTKVLVRLLKKLLHVSLVYDVNYGADLTTLIDVDEAVAALETEGATLPIYTSCCPAWINLAEQRVPERLGQISTAKSCVEMVGALVRRRYPDAHIVEVMPCSAKKSERLRQKVIDSCITVVELQRVFKEMGVTNETFAPLETDVGFDEPYGHCSGSAYIFGRTGGVAEAVMRQLSLRFQGHPNYVLLSEETDPQTHLVFRTVNVGYKRPIKVCVAQGGNQVIPASALDRSKADLVEQMACKGGCQCGGGMPQSKNALQRAHGMQEADNKTAKKSAGEIEDLESLTMSHEEIHALLHTTFKSRPGK